MTNYILDGQKVVPVADTLEWARWFEKAERTVARDKTPNGAEVSTVFLGLDHSFGRSGPPIVFETMVFGGHLDGMQERYATWDEAIFGHAQALADALRHDAAALPNGKAGSDE